MMNEDAKNIINNVHEQLNQLDSILKSETIHEQLVIASALMNLRKHINTILRKGNELENLVKMNKKEGLL
jgi:hypothetical protein